MSFVSFLYWLWRSFTIIPVRLWRFNICCHGRMLARDHVGGALSSLCKTMRFLAGMPEAHP